MPFVREADKDDLENPAIAKMGAPKAKQFSDSDAEQNKGCDCSLLRKGWVWAVVICVTVVCVVAPIGVKTTKRLNDPVTDIPKYKFNGTGLNTTVPGMYDAAAWSDGNETLTCQMVSTDLPEVSVPAGSPPPPLKVQGAQLVTADGKIASIHGINWFGFNNGKTMLDGLDAEKESSWEGGDFATIVFTLKLLGFNAVRLPFLFNDLYNLQPHDYSKPCPAEMPSAEELGARATAPGSKTNKPVPFTFLTPQGFQPGVCNAYLPSGPSTLTRYLWVVDFVVQSGFYVLVDYHPHAEGESVLDSVADYTNSWLRLWMSLRCMPNWQTQLQGRVFLDLLNEPDAPKITWDGSDSSKPPLSEYYLSAMDAIHSQAPGETLFFIQGGGQDKLGTSWGDGFATDPKWIQERGMADANAFFQALGGRPYAGHVVLAPHLYGVSVSKSPDVGDSLWDKYAVSWGYLQEQGYCNSTSKCQVYPVAAGEIGSAFNNTLDVEYYNDMAKFFRKEPPADAYPSVAFNNWFWWCYNANSGDTGGIVGNDWQTLQWNKLQWLQKQLGLTPWYKRA